MRNNPPITLYNNSAHNIILIHNSNIYWAAKDKFFWEIFFGGKVLGSRVEFCGRAETGAAINS